MPLSDASAGIPVVHVMWVGLDDVGRSHVRVGLFDVIWAFGIVVWLLRSCLYLSVLWLISGIPCECALGTGAVAA